MYRHWQNNVSSIAKYAAENEMLDPNEACPYPTVGGFAVSQPLYDFMQALQAKNKGLRFGVTRYLSYTTERNPLSNKYYQVFQMLLVYREGDTYGMGRIGFHNPNLNGRSAPSSADMYIVYSRDIENSKYRSHSDSYNVRGSKRLSTAVTLALKHLKVCTPLEIAGESKNEYVLHVSKESTATRNQLREVKSKMHHTSMESAVLNELIAARIKGYSFDNPQVMAYVNEYEQAQAAYEQDGHKDLRGYHVRMYVHAGATMVDITSFVHLKGNATAEGTQTVSIDDVPEDIMGKMAVLAMLKDDEYVQGVGMKVSDEIVWVDRDAQ